ncbi:TPA: DUF3265 domain-containing protein [Vibrio parahaemolyticus]|nr:DUF3265 domain-containing protein [Vibrio parahaemolyticus]
MRVLLIIGLIPYQSQRHNKRFKTDSQRVAFLPCVDFCDLGGMRRHSSALLTT